mmetsp:Transcript_1690/g.3543  ORF Transcript_1690/g.3543 Transcript_1690/m.3543 type:complete len:617 (-) Transcript_1690:117-1967(-)
MCCRRFRETVTDEDGDHVPLIKTWAADLFFGILIVVSALLLGVDIELSLQQINTFKDVLFWIEFGFLVMFVVELIMRVWVDGCKYFLFFPNLLDTFIIGCSVVEYIVIAAVGDDVEISALSLMRIFRLLRILRVIRLIRVCPKLYRICTSLVAAVRAVSWVFLLLFVFMYISALSCTVLLSNSQVPLIRDNFGGVFPSLYIHFVILTVEGFPELVAAIAEESGWLWYIYFCCYILFTNVMVMNTVTGVICQTVVSQGSADPGAKAQCFKEFDKLKEVVLDCMLLEGLSYDVHDEMSFEVFQQVMRNPGVRASFDAVEVCLDLEEEQLFNIIDENGDGKLSFEEFFLSLWRLRGSKERLHSLLVQSDIVHTHKRMRDRVAQMSEDLQACSSQECEMLSSALTERCREMKGRLEEQLQRQQTLRKDEPRELAKKQLTDLLESMQDATATARTTLSKLEEEILAKRSRIVELKERVQTKMMMQEIEDDVETTSPTSSHPKGTCEGDAPEVHEDVASSLSSPTSRTPAKQSEGESPSPRKERERMESRRRLQQMHQSFSTPTQSAEPKASNHKWLRTFHGHEVATQSVAKAATYATSSESESEGHGGHGPESPRGEPRGA